MSATSKLASALLMGAIFITPAKAVTVFTNAATFDVAAGPTKDVETGRTYDRSGTDLLYTSSFFAGVVDKQGFKTLAFSATPLGDYVELDDLQFAFSVVPEPSTWLLLIVGFGLAGSQMRRRSVPTNAHIS